MNLYTERDKNIAERQLEAIDQTKGHIERFCRELNIPLHLGIDTLSSDEFAKRIEFVREAFDEMFFESRESAKEIIDSYETHSENQHIEIETREILHG